MKWVCKMNDLLFFVISFMIGVMVFVGFQASERLGQEYAFVYVALMIIISIPMYLSTTGDSTK